MGYHPMNRSETYFYNKDINRLIDEWGEIYHNIHEIGLTPDDWNLFLWHMEDMYIRLHTGAIIELVYGEYPY